MNIGALSVSLQADAAGVKKGVREASGALEGMGSVVKRLGSTMAGAFAAHQLVSFGASAVKVASDAAEAASRFDAVFGGGGGEMNAWIKDMQSSIPATRAELQGMTSNIQDLLVPLGVAPTAASEMTQSLLR